MRRRGVLLGLLGLGGCGFHPLYLPATGSAGDGVNADLSTIYVPVMPTREGQLMRQALQRRFDGPNSGVAKVYDIVALPAIAQEGIGILRDNSTTRYRLNGAVTWYLRKLDVAHTVIATGTARAVDGYNVINGQYFALDLEAEAVRRQVVEALADQVTQGVAIYLRRQAAGAQSTVPVGTVAPTVATPPPTLDVPGFLPPGAVPPADLPGTFQPLGL